MTYFCWLNSDAGLYLSGSSACCITVRPEAASELVLLFEAVKTYRNFHPGQEKSLFYHIFAFIRLVSDSSNRDAGLCYPPKFWHLLFDLSPGLGATKALPPSSQRTRFNRGCSHAELLRRNMRHSRADSSRTSWRKERQRRAQRIWPIIHVKYEAGATLRWGERHIMAELELPRHRLPQTT